MSLPVAPEEEWTTADELDKRLERPFYLLCSLYATLSSGSSSGKFIAFIEGEATESCLIFSMAEESFKICSRFYLSLALSFCSCIMASLSYLFIFSSCFWSVSSSSLLRVVLPPGLLKADDLEDATSFHTTESNIFYGSFFNFSGTVSKLATYVSYRGS